METFYRAACPKCGYTLVAQEPRGDDEQFECASCGSVGRATWTLDKDEERLEAQDAGERKRILGPSRIAMGVVVIVGFFLLAKAHYGPTPELTIEAPRVEPPRDSAISTLRAYLSAPSWRERVPLVLKSPRTISLMEAAYEGEVWRPTDFQILTKAEPECTVGDSVTIDAVVNGSTTQYYLTKLDAGYLVDWESSRGANQMSPVEFRATTPARPVRFRALAQLDDFFNYNFVRLRGFAYSIKLRDASGSQIGYGYVLKDLEAGHKLFDALRDGGERRVVVDLQYPPKPWPPETSDLFMIVNVLNANGWYVEIGQDQEELFDLRKISIK